MGETRIRIVQDEVYESPREECNLGHMVCWHSRHELGDKHDFATPKDFDEFLVDEEKKGTVVRLPLYLYDHSGISMSTSNAYPYNCPWDAGQVGWIYCTEEEVEKEYKEATDENMSLAAEVLEAEVDRYCTYLMGDVWGYVLEEHSKCDKCGHEEWEVLDSCWGFYGVNYKENGMLEHVDKEHHHLFKDCKQEFI